MDVISFIASSLILHISCSVAVLQLDGCSILPPAGRNDPNRIEGRAAEPDSRPWIVLVWISCEGQEVHGTSASLRTCQGTLIRDDWVLTTAGCFPCGETASVIVDIGLHNSDIRIEVALQRPVERIGADAVYLHPDYDFSNYSYDLALVHLSRAVKNASSRAVSLIDCNGGRADVSVGNFGVSSGWGATQTSSSLDPKPLQDAFVCLWPSQVCNQVMGTNVSGIICAGSEPAQPSRMRSVHFDESLETCFAERGSPLMISQAVVKETDDGGNVRVVCEWRVYGVLLFGMNCDRLERIPGVYADVCSSRTWIENAIKKEEELLLVSHRCQMLPAPPINGYLCSEPGLAQSAGRAHRVVELCCNAGFRLEGNSTAVCNVDTGVWEMEMPTCTAVACPSLHTSSHSTTSPRNCAGASYQEVCWFSCETGYTLTDRELLVCNEYGEWSHPAPLCLPVDCGRPPHGGNLVVEFNSTVLGSVSTYSCKTCFKIASGSEDNISVKRYCNKTGQWTGPQPICRVAHCTELLPPVHGVHMQTTTTCGSQVRLECRQGYAVSGYQTLTCMESGQWNHPPPTCEPIQCQLPTIEDSAYKDSNFTIPYGSELAVECAACRRVVGERTLRCQEDGRWDKPLPSCQWVTCPLPGFIAGGTISPLGQLYFCGTTVNFTCDRGHKLVGAQASTCTQSGTWNSTFPECREVFCPALSVRRGRVRQSGRRMGDVAQVWCGDSCHVLRGNAEKMRCLESGEWDSAIPHCQRITCPPLEPIAHGSVLPTTPDSTPLEGGGCGDTVSFTCDPGYALIGPPFTTCNESGLWSNQEPFCQTLQCSRVPDPKPNSHFCTNNESTSPRETTTPSAVSPFHAVLHYCCDVGFSMESGHDGIVACGQQGTWNATSPHCHAITCEAPVQPINGFMFVQERTFSTATLAQGYYMFSTVVTFSCGEGYRRVGPVRIICTAGGEWSGDTPVCVENTVTSS